MTTLKIRIYYNNWLAKLMLRYARWRWPEKTYNAWGCAITKNIILFSTSSNLVSKRHLVHEVVHTLQYYKFNNVWAYWWDYFVKQLRVPYHDKWQEVEARKYSATGWLSYIKDFNLDVEQILFY